MAGFSDEYAILSADHGAAFAQGKLDDARVQLVFLRPGDRLGGSFDCGKIDDTAFCFGNDFVFDDENVARFEHKVVLPQRSE